MNGRPLLAALAGGSAALAGCSFGGGDDAPTVTPAALGDATTTRPSRSPSDATPEASDTDEGSVDRPLGAANVGSLAAGDRRVAFPLATGDGTRRGSGRN
jgi:hypothetical protein